MELLWTFRTAKDEIKDLEVSRPSMRGACLKGYLLLWNTIFDILFCYTYLTIVVSGTY